MKPFRKWEQPVSRVGERRVDPQESAEFVQAIGLVIGLGKMGAELVGFGAGMTVPFARDERGNYQSATGGRNSDELEQFLCGLDTPRQLGGSQRGTDNVQQNAGISEQDREARRLDLRDDLGDARHSWSAAPARRFGEVHELPAGLRIAECLLNLGFEVSRTLDVDSKVVQSRSLECQCDLPKVVSTDRLGDLLEHERFDLPANCGFICSQKVVEGDLVHRITYLAVSEDEGCSNPQLPV